MLTKNLHSIFKDEYYSQNEFESFMHVYSIVTDYMKYYNESTRHGSIKFMSPHKFYAAFIDDKVNAKVGFYEKYKDIVQI